MAFVRKCPNCGLDLTDPFATRCPVCSTTIVASTVVAPRPVGIWVAGLFQIALCTIFMLVFGFPKIMIPIFAVLILIGTAFGARVKLKPAAAPPVARRPVSNPILLKIIGFVIALCSLACLAIVLFGFVIFMNAWARWHLYEGQPYRRSEFQVKRVYYQQHAKGGAYISASGIVEDRLEYMSLHPYLHTTPHSEAELDARVPVGTMIPIYLFPNLKGHPRVQVYDPVPPAEASHRMAVSTVKNTFLALAVAAGVLFVLARLRQLCFADSNSVLQQVGTG